MPRPNSTPLRAAVGLSCLAFLGVTLGGCDLIKKKDDAATAAPAPAPAPDPNAAPAPAQPAQPAGGSAMPAQNEWTQAGRVDATNAGAAGCEVKQLREWVRVACGVTGSQSGSPIDVTISRPGKRDAQRNATGGFTSLIFPFEEGQDLEATFVWQKQARVFTSRWTPGTPQPPYVGAFGTPIERRTDQCDHDRDCGAARQCCLTSGGRGICRERGKDVCRDDNLYTKCSTDAECRREQSTKSVCQYSDKVGTKICVWDKDGSRTTTDDQGKTRPPTKGPSKGPLQLGR